jgi:hypothetical protein
MLSYDTMALVVRPLARAKPLSLTQLLDEQSTQNSASNNTFWKHLHQLHKTSKKHLHRPLPCNGSPGRFVPPVGCFCCGTQRRTSVQRPWRTVLREQARCRNTCEETQYTTTHRPCGHSVKRKWQLTELDVRQCDTSASGRREWNLLAATGKSCCIAAVVHTDELLFRLATWR